LDRPKFHGFWDILQRVGQHRRQHLLVVFQHPDRGPAHELRNDSRVDPSRACRFLGRFRSAVFVQVRARGSARAPKLSREQLAQVELELAKGAEANGSASDLWTLKCLAELIERVNGASYHPARVWYILR
jgi:hypothetical protein